MSFTSQIWPDEYCEFDAETAWKFVLKCKTWNESEQEVQPFPDKEFLRLATENWVEVHKNGGTLIIEKCRRMVISWLYRALELWRMGFERFDHLLVSLTSKSAASHCWRYLHIYTEIKRDNPDWNLPEPSILKEEGDRYLKQFSLPNGSITTTHHADAGNIRGSGMGGITIEELPAFPSPSSIYAQAKILTKGSAKSGKSGAVVAIGNTHLNEDWREIKACVGEEPSPLPGFERHRLKDGGRYLKIHYYADPDKDSAWLEAVRQDMIGTPDEFEREILMMERLTDGKKVYSQFVESIHAPIELIGKKIKHEQHSTIYMGWDCGTASLMPAVVVAQHTTRNHKLPLSLQLLMEVVSPKEGMSLEEFVPYAMQKIREAYPSIDWTQVRHFCDPAGNARSGMTGGTAFDYMYTLGIHAEPVTNALAVRVASVSKLLNTELTTGHPMFIINRSLCKTVTDGFLGGYRMPVIRTGTTHRAGQPIKDHYSHPHDALQYLAIGFWESVEVSGHQVLNRIKFREPNHDEDDQ